MRKKISVLLAISVASILPDYGSATGAVTLVPQGASPRSLGSFGADAELDRLVLEPLAQLCQPFAIRQWCAVPCLPPDRRAESSLDRPVFMLGVGGITACILSQAYGRWPVAVWLIAMSLVWAILCAAAPGFEAFMAARILNGMFAAGPQATGLMFIRVSRPRCDGRARVWTS